MDPQQLLQFFEKRKGATFATIYCITEPKMNKTGNPYHGTVVHQYCKNIRLGNNYANAVNRQWEQAETDEVFFAEQLWKGAGEFVNSYIVRHKKTGEQYLKYILKTNADGIVMPSQVDEYRHKDTGEIINKSELEPFFPKKAPSKSQRVVELDTVEVFPRVVKINGGQFGKYRLGVQSIKIDGEQFLIEV